MAKFETEKTNQDILTEWDNGGIVWTCEMGGLGPGYEQCIQILGFEMLRAMLDNPAADWTLFDHDKKAWEDYRKEIEKAPNVSAATERLQVTGAQFGGAMSIASVFARRGYSDGMNMVPEDRRIQVSNNWPK